MMGAERLKVYQIGRLLGRLRANTRALLISPTLLRLFSLFIERRDLQAPIPVDVSVACYAKRFRPQKNSF